MKWKNALVASTFALSLLLLPTASASAMVSKEAVDTLTQVYTKLVDTHYTHPDQEKLLQAAIKGMLNELNDPFTNYMSPEEYQGFVGAIEQSFAGIGVIFTPAPNEGALIVKEVYKGTPAEKAGLQAGDRVLGVDGMNVTADNVSEVPAKIRGKQGTAVVLKVKHGEEEPKSVSIIRSKIELPLIKTEDLGDGIGYLNLMSFGDRAEEEFRTALAELQKKNIQSLVLDLRGNGGGHVLPAVQIADMFLDKGTIMRTHQNGTVHDSDADSEVNMLPIVVLIDRHTASASEILAGALQKNGRAKLVGTQSYGKGTMQYPEELPNGGFLKVSIDRWELSDGTSPDKVGLTPDVRINSKNPVSALNAAMQLLKPTRAQELSFSRTEATATLNGHKLTDVPTPVVGAEGAYLPLRFAVEALGQQVDWVAADAAVKFQLGGHAVTISMSNGELKIDGQPTRYANPVRTVDGSTYISADTMGEILGELVEVNDKEVRVRTK